MKYALAPGVTAAPMPDGGCVITDVPHDRVYGLNPSAAGLLSTIVGGPNLPTPPLVETMVEAAYDETVCWSEKLTHELLQLRIIREETRR